MLHFVWFLRLPFSLPVRLMQCLTKIWPRQLRNALAAKINRHISLLQVNLWFIVSNLAMQPMLSNRNRCMTITYGTVILHDWTLNSINYSFEENWKVVFFSLSKRAEVISGKHLLKSLHDEFQTKWPFQGDACNFALLFNKLLKLKIDSVSIDGCNLESFGVTNAEVVVSKTWMMGSLSFTYAFHPFKCE